MLKAVLFDMDGVIIDSEPMHARTTILALKKFNVDITLEYLSQFTGSTIYYMCNKIIQDFNIDTTVEALISAITEIRDIILKEEGHTVVPYIIDLIKSLYESGMKLIIASSSPSDAIQEVMETLKIKQYFIGFISGTQVKHPKPAPDIFLEAAKLLEVSPEECVVIEDSSNGVNAAFAAGMTCIGFSNPNSGNQDLRQASILVEGFEEIDFDFVNQVYRYDHLEPTTILTTDRLVIRELTVEDIDTLYQIYQAPETNLFLTDSKDTLDVEKEKHKAYIQNVYHFYGFGLWGVFLKENQCLIGHCGIELKSVNGSDNYELGYLIDKNYRGHGYAMESVKAVIEYSFTKLNVPRIVANIDKKNLHSIHLAEKIGMKRTQECVIKQHECFQYELTRE